MKRVRRKGSDGMTDHVGRPAVAPPDPQLLAESLRAVAAAFDQARISGLSVSLPEALYLACLEIVDRHDLPGGKPPGGRDPHRDAAVPPTPAGTPASRTVKRVKMQDVPLRRLIWQVINPGEEFSVADVSARLAELGASWPTTAVSNVLGYWASSERMTRIRKGTYTYPHPGSLPGALASPTDQQQEGPAASINRPIGGRGKEHSDVSISHTREEAAS
jgi:hypothetical protein